MWLFNKKGPSGFSSSSTAEEVTQEIDGNGLTAIVTGASSGIGAETARVLALRGVHVVMAVRNMAAGRKIKEKIVKEIPSAKVDTMELDLSSIASVNKFASEYNSSKRPLNLLINNAGVMATPFMLSKDDIELQFATNHLGHFLLTHMLLDKMKETARKTGKEGRIVNVASEAHRFAYREGIRFDKINDQACYSRWGAYGQSKLANILHAKELARQLKNILWHGSFVFRMDWIPLPNALSMFLLLVHRMMGLILLQIHFILELLLLIFSATTACWTVRINFLCSFLKVLLRI